MVESLRQRGWPQDDIDTFFRDWRSDEENSEKEQLTHCVTGTPPSSAYPSNVFDVNTSI